MQPPQMMKMTCPLTSYKKLVRQLTDSEMTADDYVKIHSMEETGQTLDDKSIFKLIAVDNPDVLVNGDDEDGTSDDGISHPVTSHSVRLHQVWKR